MRTIWKYEIPVADDFSLLMPAGAEVLTVQVQNDKPMLWCIVDPDLPQDLRWFKMHGTGHPIEEVRDYIATFQMHGGALVLHVFNGTAQ